MPEQFVKAIRDNAPMIEHFLGSLNDIKVESDYDKLVSQLDDYEKQQQDYFKFSAIADKLRTTHLNAADYYNQTQHVNTDDPALTTTKAYNDYATKIADPQYANLSFADYLAQNPSAKTELQNANLLVTTKTLKPKEELDKMTWDKTGLDAADIEWYKNYKQANPKMFNANLASLFVKNAADLVSSGEAKDKFLKLYQMRLQNLAMPEKAPTKYDVKVDEKNGTLIYANPDNPTDYFTVPYANPDDKVAQDQKNWYVDKTPDGKFAYYVDAPKDGKTQKTLVRYLSEYETQQQELEDAKKQAELDNLNKRTDNIGVRHGRGSTSSGLDLSDAQTYSTIKSYGKLRLKLQNGGKLTRAEQKSMKKMQDDLKTSTGKPIEEIDNAMTEIMKQGSDKKGKQVYAKHFNSGTSGGELSDDEQWYQLRNEMGYIESLTTDINDKQRRGKALVDEVWNDLSPVNQKRAQEWLDNMFNPKESQPNPND